MNIRKKKLVSTTPKRAILNIEKTCNKLHNIALLGTCEVALDATKLKSRILLKTKIDANSVETLRLTFMASVYLFAEEEKKKYGRPDLELVRTSYFESQHLYSYLYFSPV